MKNQRFQTFTLLVLSLIVFVAAGLRTYERTILDYQGEQYSVKLIEKSGSWIVKTTGSASGPTMINKTGGLVEILSILNPDRKVLLQDDLAGGKYEIEVLTESVPVEDILPLVFSQVADAMGLQYTKTTVEVEAVCLLGSNGIEPLPAEDSQKGVKATTLGSHTSLILDGHTLSEIGDYLYQEFDYRVTVGPNLDPSQRYKVELKFSSINELVESFNDIGFSANRCDVAIPAIIIKEK